MDFKGVTQRLTGHMKKTRYCSIFSRFDTVR